ncbi:MAG TPA: arylsulfotransferase family protein, partial [Chitinophagales bacterium]|nr:arylsulfotransferase family protein [Chitinophagales bacterium]
MKILSVFFAFISTVQMAMAQFNYISPVPGSLYHNPQTNIILKNGELLDKASVADKDLLEIVGSVSGNHTWTARLSDDNKTVVIHPSPVFEYGETVYVSVSNKLKKASGAFIDGTFFSFQTRNAITPEEQLAYSQYRHEDFVESFGYDPIGNTEQDFFETPDSFPTFVINVNNNPSPGRIFFANQQELDEQDTNSFPTIIENDGSLYWAKDAGRDGHDFKINHNGYLSYYSYNYSWWIVLDSNFNKIDSLQCGNGYEIETNGHDFQMFNDGHYYIQAFNDLTIDMTAYGGMPNAIVKGLIIQELDQNKDVVFQWRSWDHFLFTDANQWTPLTNSKVDYVHGNAVERDFDGNILISCRNMDELTKINRETGEIIWRMGGENNQFTFVNDNIPQHFSQQHDLRRIANGNITLFNNGNKLPPEISSAKEYHLDEVNKVATLVWYYEHPDVGNNHVFARASGNAQRLPNGNTIISWGTIYFNKGIPSMTEVDYDKNIVWEMTYDEEGQKSYRTYKFDFIRCPLVEDSSLVMTFSSADSVVLEWGDPNNSSSFIFEYKLSADPDWI